MPLLAFSSQDPEVIGPKVAETVGKELGIDPPPYEVIMADAASTSVKTVLGDAGRFLFGGGTTTLFVLSFNISDPRPFTIRASVARQGTGSAVLTLLYSTKLSGTVDAETNLEDPNVFGKAKFIGGSAASKLNANGDLVKRANKLARQESQVGALTIKIQRMFRIVPPGDEPCTLLVATLARPVSMGFGSSMDLKEFTDLAALVEKTL